MKFEILCEMKTKNGTKDVSCGIYSTYEEAYKEAFVIVNTYISNKRIGLVHEDLDNVEVPLIILFREDDRNISYPINIKIVRRV